MEEPRKRNLVIKLKISDLCARNIHNQGQKEDDRFSRVYKNTFLRVECNLNTFSS
jgi:hypothetical protein